MTAEFRIGEWRIRPELGELEGPGGVVRVERRSLEVLLDLAEHPGEIRSRQDLLAAVWGNAFVTEEVLTHAIWDLRRALGDSAREPRYIQTLARRGYRLVAPVTAGPEGTERTGAGAPPVPRGRLGRWAAALALVAAVAASIAYGTRQQPERQPEEPSPLRVAVTDVEVEGAGTAADPATREAARRVASGVLVATLNALAAYEDVVVIDPWRAGEGPETPVELARAVAADEVLGAGVELRGNLARVTLRRNGGEDGRLLWVDSFEVPAAPGEARLLADTVRRRLRLGLHLGRGRGLAGQRRAIPRLEVRDEDYAAFLDVWRRLDAGGDLEDADLETLEGIVTTSPRFLEAYLLGAELAQGLYEDRRRIEDRRRALRLLAGAQALAPSDPRPWVTRFRLELEGADPSAAQAALERLEDLSADPVEVLELRARLLESQGRHGEALAVRREAVELRPTWQALFRLARIEHRRGEVAAARARVAELLERLPGNRWALALAAEIELFSGDLAVAAEHYATLSRRYPERRYVTNLGVARFLRRDYAAAAASYRRALELAPEHPLVLVNLAEAEAALGRQEEARTLYRRALDRLAANEARANLGPRDAMLKAHGLARLGRARESVEATLEALESAPEDSEVRYLAAVVYSLVGDEASALVHARRALEMGVQPRWFRIPAFEPLAGEAAFEELLAPKPRAAVP
ncbi:MAG: winged helix-turn-helix domain-containing protein [Thermoanaerobaculia bacterium]